VLALAALAGPAAAGPIQGTWRGQCDREGKQPVHGELVIGNGAATFFGGPVQRFDLRPPHIEFDTTAGASGTSRHFTGSFSPDFNVVTGTLTQGSDKAASCRFTYAN